ncbi:MAG: 2-oxoglutarate dehydrogenase complex dihydrolipoyllysine-residue succinyltransferase [Cytophagales bacterium]|nr:2-oxoglutarate dehydrogenase complex dihydrolipoyllysine-residue succinyltransferase [Bernardetiaceae bacterium]MDW8205877.1 2-oxoglutarate dehydrogenase complex dihydrolipoyllysine-residue succinyltransferase [Cytophagales bacterium]
MTIEMKVPAVGESVTQVTIANWIKKEGEYVKTDEILCELESDKATFELPAEADGILHIVAPTGTTLNIGDVICRIATTVEEAKASLAADASAVAVQKIAQAGGKQEVVVMEVPQLGESITEVTLAQWLKRDGDFVKMDEPICEIESDKATFEVAAKASGILKIIALDKKTLAIGEPICEIIVSDAIAQPVAPTAQQQTTAIPNTTTSSSYATGHASPAAAKILAEKGISPQEVQGTGKDGRITKEDAQNAQKTVQQPTATASPSTTPSPAPPVQPELRGTRREKMSSLRKTVSRRLVAVKNETAMLTTFNEVNMKPIMDLRAKYKDLFKEKHEVGLGFMSFFVKASCIALQEFPAVNAQIDGDDIVYHDFCDISIAVSAPKGLVVPVVRNAEKMTFAEIEKEIVRLATRARENKLSIPEMTGGTFTITNGGVFGSLMSTPIINAPQVAILGMHNIVERPIAENGQVVIRPMMYVALSYDHRIIDGRESVSFLVRIKQLLEDPARMLLGV